jgi:ArsR family transcriptional regulator, arsenate/arsenite/antimonite-responsive transcriptional repressor
MKTFLRVMKALSDPNRVKILKLLQYRPGMCVCELQSLLSIAQPTVSKHLKALEDADLVRSRKEGTWVNYSLSDGGANPYAAKMLADLRDWLEDHGSEVSAILTGVHSASREQLCSRISIREASEEDISQVEIGWQPTKIIGLKAALEAVSSSSAGLTDNAIASALIKRLRKSNYILPQAVKAYEAAFLREYKNYSATKQQNRRSGYKRERSV